MGNTATKEREPRSVLEVPSQPGSPTIVPRDGNAENQWAYLNQPCDCVIVTWDAPDDDGGSPITNYVLERRLVLAPLATQTQWVRAYADPFPVTQLALSNLVPGHTYEFRVKAQNIVGLSATSRASEPFTAPYDPNLACEPRFVEPLRDVTALEHERVEFRAEIRGVPPPGITWYKDGIEVQESPNTEVWIHENGQCGLVFLNVNLRDSGDIKCVANNGRGQAIETALLIVETPPRALVPKQYEEGLIFETGDTIRLKIGISGRPVPEISWYHETNKLEPVGRYEIETSNQFSTLKVLSATRQDRGEYSVRLVSGLGDDTGSILVTITNRPTPPGRPRITEFMGNSVVLEWDPPEDDGGCKIGNYVVEYFRMGWNVWLKATACRQLSAKLGDLIPGSTYKFRIKAENPYGMSESSPESIPVILSDSAHTDRTWPTMLAESNSVADVDDTTVGSSILPLDSVTEEDTSAAIMFLMPRRTTFSSEESLKEPDDAEESQALASIPLQTQSAPDLCCTCHTSSDVRQTRQTVSCQDVLGAYLDKENKLLQSIEEDSVSGDLLSGIGSTTGDSLSKEVSLDVVEDIDIDLDTAQTEGPSEILHRGFWLPKSPARLFVHEAFVSSPLTSFIEHGFSSSKGAGAHEVASLSWSEPRLEGGEWTPQQAAFEADSGVFEALVKEKDTTLMEHVPCSELASSSPLLQGDITEETSMVGDYQSALNLSTSPVAPPSTTIDSVGRDEEAAGDSPKTNSPLSLVMEDECERFEDSKPTHEMKPQDNPDLPFFVRALAGQSVKVGTRARLLAEIKSSSKVHVNWRLNEKVIEDDASHRLLQEGTFFGVDIAPVFVGDEGVWTCEAANFSGSTSSSASLRVIVPKSYKAPEFVEELRALLTQEGTVSLECKVVGIPTPVLKWFKDGQEIKAGDVFALTARADDPTSLGVYTCEAVNCVGKAVSSSKVHVLGCASRESSAKPLSPPVTPACMVPAPVIVEDLFDQKVKVGEGLRLGIRVSDPSGGLVVQWFNKDELKEPCDKYHYLDEGEGIHTLEISPLELEDEGEWKCIVSNDGGQAASSCFITLLVPKNYRPPRFLENLKAILTEEGLVSFECKVVGFPTPQLQWFKDGQELKPGDVYQLSGTNSLGSYSCIARNCMGQATSSAELTVEDIQNQLNEDEKRQLLETNQPPIFLQGLRSTEAKIGDLHQFTVQVTVTPEPTVTWYRDDELIETSERYRILKEDPGIFSLEISTLSFADQADWKCIAVNDFGHSVTSCSLKLSIPRHYKKPYFLEPLKAVLSEEGTVNLECKVIGVPQPTLKWFKDGLELKPGDIHRIISGQDGTCCLGTYTCEAHNCMGESSSSAALVGFEERAVSEHYEPVQHPVYEPIRIARQPSLSTIQEERSSQYSLYETAAADNTFTEISVSIDGKEMSLSLYETPDLTEEEAQRVVELFAEEISEHYSSRNVIELPPLRFTRESATAGCFLVEAIVIDVPLDLIPDEEAHTISDFHDDLETEADIEELSAMEALVVDEHGRQEHYCLEDLEIPPLESDFEIRKSLTRLHEALGYAEAKDFAYGLGLIREKTPVVEVGEQVMSEVYTPDQLVIQEPVLIDSNAATLSPSSTPSLESNLDEYVTAVGDVKSLEMAAGEYPRSAPTSDSLSTLSDDTILSADSAVHKQSVGDQNSNAPDKSKLSDELSDTKRGESTIFIQGTTQMSVDESDLDLAHFTKQKIQTMGKSLSMRESLDEPDLALESDSTIWANQIPEEIVEPNNCKLLEPVEEEVVQSVTPEEPAPSLVTSSEAFAVSSPVEINQASEATQDVHLPSEEKSPETCYEDKETVPNKNAKETCVNIINPETVSEDMVPSGAALVKFDKSSKELAETSTVESSLAVLRPVKMQSPLPAEQESVEAEETVAKETFESNLSTCVAAPVSTPEASQVSSKVEDSTGEHVSSALPAKLSYEKVIGNVDAGETAQDVEPIHTEGDATSIENASQTVSDSQIDESDISSQAVSEVPGISSPGPRNVLTSTIVDIAPEAAAASIQKSLDSGASSVSPTVHIITEEQEQSTQRGKSLEPECHEAIERTSICEQSEAIDLSSASSAQVTHAELVEPSLRRELQVEATSPCLREVELPAEVVEESIADVHLSCAEAVQKLELTAVETPQEANINHPDRQVVDQEICSREALIHLAVDETNLASTVQSLEHANIPLVPSNAVDQGIIGLESKEVLETCLWEKVKSASFDDTPTEEQISLSLNSTHDALVTDRPMLQSPLQDLSDAVELSDQVAVPVLSLESPLIHEEVKADMPEHASVIESLVTEKVPAALYEPQESLQVQETLAMSTALSLKSESGKGDSLPVLRENVTEGCEGFAELANVNMCEAKDIEDISGTAELVSKDASDALLDDELLEQYHTAALELDVEENSVTEADISELHSALENLPQSKRIEQDSETKPSLDSALPCSPPVELQPEPLEVSETEPQNLEVPSKLPNLSENVEVIESTQNYATERGKHSSDRTRLDENLPESSEIITGRVEQELQPPALNDASSTPLLLDSDISEYIADLTGTETTCISEVQEHPHLPGSFTNVEANEHKEIGECVPLATGLTSSVENIEKMEESALPQVLNENLVSDQEASQVSHEDASSLSTWNLPSTKAASVQIPGTLDIAVKTSFVTEGEGLGKLKPFELPTETSHEAVAEPVVAVQVCETREIQREDQLKSEDLKCLHELGLTASLAQDPFHSIQTEATVVADSVELKSPIRTESAEETAVMHQEIHSSTSPLTVTNIQSWVNVKPIECRHTESALGAAESINHNEKQQMSVPQEDSSVDALDMATSLTKDSLMFHAEVSSCRVAEHAVITGAEAAIALPGLAKETLEFSLEAASDKAGEEHHEAKTAGAEKRPTVEKLENAVSGKSSEEAVVKAQLEDQVVAEPKLEEKISGRKGHKQIGMEQEKQEDEELVVTKQKEGDEENLLTEQQKYRDENDEAAVGTEQKEHDGASTKAEDTIGEEELLKTEEAKQQQEIIVKAEEMEYEEVKQEAQSEARQKTCHETEDVKAQKKGEQLRKVEPEQENSNEKKVEVVKNLGEEDERLKDEGNARKEEARLGADQEKCEQERAAVENQRLEEQTKAEEQKREVEAEKREEEERIETEQIRQQEERVGLESQEKKRQEELIESEKKREEERLEAEQEKYSEVERMLAEKKIQEDERLKAEELKREEEKRTKSKEKKHEEERLEAERRQEEESIKTEEKKREEKERMLTEKKKREEEERNSEEKKRREEELLRAEEKRHREDECVKADKKKREEEQRILSVQKKWEEEQLKAEEENLREEERLKDEEKRREEEVLRLAEKKQREEEERLKAEEERHTEEERSKAEENEREEARILGEKKKREEEERILTEKKKREEEERLKADEERRKEEKRIEAEEKKLEARILAEQKKREEEEERILAEKKREEEERIKSEEKKREEARILAENKKRKEDERILVEQKKREEEERIKAEEKQREEARILAQKKREKEERIKAEEKKREEEARVLAENTKREEERILAEKKKREEEEERLQAEEKKREEEARVLAENTKREEERILAEKKKREEEEERLQAEEKKREEEARILAEKKREEDERIKAEEEKRKEARILAEKKREEEERILAEKKKREEEERIKAEEKKREEDRLKAEEKKRMEEERIKEEKHREEEERKQAEKKKQEEEERVKAEQKRLEEERILAEKKKFEEERLKAEQQRCEEEERQKAEKKKREEEKRRKAEKKKRDEEERILAEKKKREEEERKDAEKKREEEERILVEKKKREAEERILAERKKREEEERKNAEKKQREEEERILSEKKKHEEEERLKAEQKKRVEEECVKAEEKKRLEEKKRAEEQQRLDAERKKREEKERIEAEQQKREEEQRKEEAERQRLEAERCKKEAEEKQRLEETQAQKSEAERQQQATKSRTEESLQEKTKESKRKDSVKRGEPEGETVSKKKTDETKVKRKKSTSSKKAKKSEEAPIDLPVEVSPASGSVQSSTEKTPASQGITSESTTHDKNGVKTEQSSTVTSKILKDDQDFSVPEPPSQKKLPSVAKSKTTEPAISASSKLPAPETETISESWESSVPVRRRRRASNLSDSAPEESQESLDFEDVVRRRRVRKTLSIEKSVERDLSVSSTPPEIKFEPVLLKKHYEDHSTVQFTPRESSRYEEATYKGGLRDPKNKPKFSTKLRDMEAARGSNIKLTCSVLGSPEPHVEWYKNGFCFSEEDSDRCRVSYEANTGIAILELRNVAREDSGEYTCIAKNCNGRSSVSADLRIRGDLDSEPSPPTFVSSLCDSYDSAKDELVLDCVVRGYPQPKITWIKDGAKLHLSSRHRQFLDSSGKCKLLIYAPSMGDAGHYTCVADNRESTDEVSAFINVPEHAWTRSQRPSNISETCEDEEEAPTFSQALSDQKVHFGGSITFHVSVSGSPEPEVCWLFNNSRLSPSSKVRYLTPHRGIHSFSIYNITASDLGTYACRATNVAGTAQCEAILTFKDSSWNTLAPPPLSSTAQPSVATFIEKPDSFLDVARDQDLILACTVAGYPKPSLQWTKGSRELSLCPRVTIEELEDNTHRLTLKKSTYADSGTYCIQVRNCHGSQRAFCTVRVKEVYITSGTPWELRGTANIIQELQEKRARRFNKDVPGPIPSPPTATAIGKNFVSLSWSKPSSNGGAPIMAYKVEAWLIGEGAHWTELAMSPITSYDAYNLKPEREYLFRITPRNKYGWGEPITSTSPIKTGALVQTPRFTTPLHPQMKVLLGSRISLQSEVFGVPIPRIKWSKDGSEIDSSKQSRYSIRVEGTHQVLTIDEVSPDDDAKFVCEANNAGGTCCTSSRLLVVEDPRVVEADENFRKQTELLGKMDTGKILAPQFTMRPRDRRVQVTYPVRLTCQVVGFPKPEVTWKFNYSPILPDERHTFSVDGDFHTLEISNTKFDDAGLYQVHAQSSQGAITCPCRLIVDGGIKAYIPPIFVHELEDRSVNMGSSINLVGRVEAYPAVGVTWYRDGVRLRPSRKYDMCLDRDGTVTLLVANAQIRDAGVYMCEVTNEMGKAETFARITVKRKEGDENKNDSVELDRSQGFSNGPRFLQKPRSTEVLEGDSLVILCEVVGDPKPEVIWLRDWLNPDYYHAADQFVREGDGPVYRLEIPCVKLDYTGAYSVIARNCHGEAKAVISLQVYAHGQGSKLAPPTATTKLGTLQKVPEISQPLRDLRCCDGDAVTFECRVSPQSFSNIRWEKSGKLLRLLDDFVPKFDGECAQLTIKRVYPEDEGEYTCIAYNELGRVSTSACLIVDVADDKENDLTVQLDTRPPGTLSTRTTPRTTPARSFRSQSPCFSRAREGEETPTPPQRTRVRAVPPKFYSVPHNKIAEVGDTVRFQCSVAGQPSPKVTWDKDYVTVRESEHVSFEERDDVRTLLIKNVTPEDAGLYRVTVENELGRIKTNARLEILTKTSYRNLGAVRSGSAGRSGLGSYYPSLRAYTRSSTTRNLGMTSRAGEIRGGSTPRPRYCTNGFKDLNTADGSAHRPLFSQGLKHVTVRDGDSLELSVMVQGTPPLEIVWVRNDKVLKHCEDYEYLHRGSGHYALRIRDTFQEDGGIYFCEAYNAYGEAETWCRVNIEAPMELLDNRGATQCATRKPVISTSNLENSVALTANSVSKREKPIVSTLKSKPVPLSARVNNIQRSSSFGSGCNKRPLSGVSSQIKLQRTSSLRSSRSTPLRSSESVTQSNDDLRTHKTDKIKLSRPSSSTKLSALKREIKEKPKAQQNPTIERKTLEPQPSFPVLSPPEQTQKLAGGFPEADILSLPVDNALDNEVFSTYDPYSTPAEIVKGPVDISALRGTDIVLEALVIGRPEPAIRWLKGGKELRPSSRVAIRHKDGVVTLAISNITADDSGKYIIMVENEHGADCHYASLAVEGPPDPPAGPPNVCEVRTDGVTLSWYGSVYDGGSMVTGYVVEMCCKPSDSWVAISDCCNSTSYVVQNLTRNGVYSFRVKAQNIHGLSVPSKESEPICLEQSLSEDDEAGEDAEIIAPFDHRITKTETGEEFKKRYHVQPDIIGKGRFGVVYRVIELETKAFRAAKYVRCIKTADREKVYQEIDIMNKLEHPKLLQLAAAFELPKEIIMVMEYIPGGELFERVVADDFTLTEKDCILFMRQIVDSVGYMHSKNIVHLDLKPENILCQSATSHQIKLIDFGLARELQTDVPVRVLFGTPEFIPPEIVSYEPISFASDMWAVGVVCYVLLSGLSPFMGDNDADTFANITRADFDFLDEAFNAISQDAKDFISALLIKRPEERLTAQNCLKHKWLAQAEKTMKAVKLPTDRLKKFIIRRKWHKTGNAIRALGRMASLSSSRRNSASSSHSPSRRSSRMDGSLCGDPLSPPQSPLHVRFPQNLDSLFVAEEKPVEKPSNVPVETTNVVFVELDNKTECRSETESGIDSQASSRSVSRSTSSYSCRSDSGMSDCSNGLSIYSHRSNLLHDLEEEDGEVDRKVDLPANKCVESSCINIENTKIKSLKKKKSNNYAVAEQVFALRKNVAAEENHEKNPYR